MKKAVAIILVVLPVFLMISISIAARIIVMFVPVPVDGVRFVDADGEEIELLELRLGQVELLNVDVMPQMADNKNYSLSMVQNQVCQLEGNQVTAIGYGSAKITVTTQEKKFKATLIVEVTDKNVQSVQLDASQKVLSLGQRDKFTATVLPTTAINRAVTWHSSLPHKVSVDAGGNIFGASATDEGEPAIITATSVDGNISASCEVIVLPELPPIAFYRAGESTPVAPGYTIVVQTATFSLGDYLKYDATLFSYESIVFSVTNGSQYLLTEDILTLLQAGVSVRVKATVTLEGVVYSCEATFRLI